MLSLLLACSLIDATDDTATGGLFCTEVGCVDGLSIDFDPPLRGEGTYLLTATDGDGVAATCQLTIPFDSNPADGCDRPDLFSITASGTKLSIEDQEIPNAQYLVVPDLLTLTLTVDDHVEKAVTLTPQSETIMPNGPDCPPVCEVASEVVDLTS